MGVAFYPVFNCREPEWPDDVDGKLLARAADRLDEVAKRAKVPTLYEFFSLTRERMICELLDGDPEDPSTFAESDIPDEKWFDPSDGLETLEVLIRHVEVSPDGIDRPSELLNDLMAFRLHLTRAQELGHKWHLAIDY